MLSGWERDQRLLNAPGASARVLLFLAVLLFAFGTWHESAYAQGGSGKAGRADQAAPRPASTTHPDLVDITDSTGISFEHRSSPEQKYIAESMSGGVALIDYDRDGWPDIYFTNAQSVEMALAGKKARSALYHNNHDGTFTDVTDSAGVGYPCSAQGAVVGDYNNDGWPDLLVTCLSGVVLYRNNGNNTFSDLTAAAGLGGDHLWATGAAFGDYDRDGWADLFVAHYVEFDLHAMAAFGSKDTCKYVGIDVQCGPRGMKGSPDTLYHNNGNGTFTDVSSRSGAGDWNTAMDSPRCGRTSITMASSICWLRTTGSRTTSTREMEQESSPMKGLLQEWLTTKAARLKPTWVWRWATTCTPAACRF